MSLTMSSEIDYVFTNIDQRVFKIPENATLFLLKTPVGSVSFFQHDCFRHVFRFVWGHRCGAPCSLHWKTQLKPYSLAFAGNEKPKR